MFRLQKQIHQQTCKAQLTWFFTVLAPHVYKAGNFTILFPPLPPANFIQYRNETVSIVHRWRDLTFRHSGASICQVAICLTDRTIVQQECWQRTGPSSLFAVTSHSCSLSFSLNLYPLFFTSAHNLCFWRKVPLPTFL